MDVMNCTIQDFLNIENYLPKEPFDGFVIVPTGELHDSGFAMMKFILCRRLQVVGAVGGGSDVVNINGIGGYGQPGRDFEEALRTGKTDRVAWCMDILPKSGCVRVFCDNFLELDPIITSSFSIYTKGPLR